MRKINIVTVGQTQYCKNSINITSILRRQRISSTDIFVTSSENGFLTTIFPHKLSSVSRVEVEHLVRVTDGRWSRQIILKLNNVAVAVVETTNKWKWEKMCEMREVYTWTILDDVSII